jgi:hypothetical protein
LQEYHANESGLIHQYVITQPKANLWLHRSLNELWETLARVKEMPARLEKALADILVNQLEVLLDAQHVL